MHKVYGVKFLFHEQIAHEETLKPSSTLIKINIICTSFMDFSVFISHNGIWNGMTVGTGRGKVAGKLAPLQYIHLKIQS